MKIMYQPTPLPVKCKVCKTVFIPDEAGDLESATNRIVAACPCCSARCDVDFAPDNLAGITGSNRFRDVRENFLKEGEIITIFDNETEAVVVARAAGVYKANEEKNAIECAYATVISAPHGTKQRGEEISFIYYCEL